MQKPLPGTAFRRQSLEMYFLFVLGCPPVEVFADSLQFTSEYHLRHLGHNGLHILSHITLTDFEFFPIALSFLKMPRLLPSKSCALTPTLLPMLQRSRLAQGFGCVRGTPSIEDLSQSELLQVLREEHAQLKGRQELVDR